MRAFLVSGCLILAACSLPGRQTFAPQPVRADAQTIAAAQAFGGRVALVTIQPGTVDFVEPLKSAVAQALAVKPDAVFRVRAEAPATTPDAQADALAKLAPQTRQVADAIIAGGVPAARVSVAAGTGNAALIAVYVK